MLRTRTEAYAVQIASHAGVSAASLLIPLFAKELGATDFEVGVIGAGYGGAIFLSAYLSGMAADRQGKRLLLRIGLILSGLTCLLQLLAVDPWTLGLSRVAFGLGAGMFPSALTAYVYDQTRKPGRFAAWGSLGFGLGTILAGALSSTGAIFLTSSLLLFASFGVSLLLAPRPEVRIWVPLFPRQVIRRNLPAYVAMLIRHTGAAAVWVVFPIYLVGLGASVLEIGVLYALNAGAQFLFMLASDRYRSGAMVVSGLALSAVTFLGFGVARELWMLYPIQLVLGASWAFLYVGSLKFVMERNEERATSTGLLQSTISLGNIVGPVLGGVVSQAAGYPATIWAALAMSVLAIPLFLLHVAAREDSRIQRRSG